MTQQSVDIAPIFDDGEFKGLPRRVVVLSALAVILDGFDVQIIAFAAPAIITDWQIDRTMLAPIFALGFVGMVIGTFLGGWLGDRIGRRNGILSSMVLFSIATGLGTFASNLEQLGVLRFVASIGLGALIPNATSMIAEWSPTRLRSLAVAVGLVCNPVGGILGGLIAAPLLPTLGWKGLFAIGGLIPIIFSIVLAFTLFESPRYLRRDQKNRPALLSILRKMGAETTTDATITDSAETSTAASASIGALFSRGLRRDTVFICLGFFAVMAALYGALTWTPTLLAANGFELAQTSVGLLFINLGGVIGSIGAGWMIGRFGSSRITVALALLGVAIALILTVIPLTPANWSLIIAAYFVFGIFILSTAACLFAISSQAYPVQLRATGVGLGVGAGRLGALIAALAGAPLIAGGSQLFYLAVAVAMLLAAGAFLAIQRHIPGIR